MEFTEGRRFEEFMENRMMRSAVERSLEIIGEAARRVSTQTREGYPHIPWKAIIGLRNVLAHEYGDIRYERLWRVCMEELGVLIRQLEQIGLEGPLFDRD